MLAMRLHQQTGPRPTPEQLLALTSGDLGSRQLSSMASLGYTSAGVNSGSASAPGDCLFPVRRFGCWGAQCGVYSPFCLAKGKLGLVVLLLKH